MQRHDVAHGVKITSLQRRCNVMTWRKYNVASTSLQRHDVASTLKRREATLYLRHVPAWKHQIVGDIRQNDLAMKYRSLKPTFILR